MKLKEKCKACGLKLGPVDLRKLCTHCALKIDTADAIASDINGIREDMWSLGIPTSGFIRNYNSSEFTLPNQNEEE
jgi:hypothetical protein